LVLPHDIEFVFLIAQFLNLIFYYLIQVVEYYNRKDVFDNLIYDHILSLILYHIIIIFKILVKLFLYIYKYILFTIL